MKKSIKSNYIYNLLYQMLILILPLITTPYISRILGAENIGIYSYTLSISAFFILFGSLGIGLYGQREIAYLQEDVKKRSKVFWEIIILKCITMSISLLIFYLTCIVKYSEYSLYYRILILEIIANMLDISWFFQGLEEFKKTVGRNTLVKLISVVCIFIFVKTSEDLPIYFIIYTLSILIGNLSLWIYLPKYVQKIKIDKLNIGAHVKPTISLFIPQIAIQVYTLLDKTMIGTIIADKSEVGYYEQTQKIIKILLTIITSLTTVMMPRIANKFANGEDNKIAEYMNISFNMVLMLAFPLMFGIFAVADEFVPLFFGQGYDKVSMLMKVICPIILFIGLSSVIGTQYLLTTKRQKEYTSSVILGSIVNFIINLMLINRMGALGASIGTIVAELTVTGVQIHYTKHDFEWGKILKSSIHYFMAGLIMFLTCLLVANMINNEALAIIAQVLVGIIVYFVTLLIFKDEFITTILDKIKEKLIV